MEQLTTSFGGVYEIPDPADIQFTAQWYFLNHISSPLISFDHDKGVFEPLLAESWEINGTTYRLRLRKDARFSDGSPITASDVSATIKRQLALKSATHFPLWKMIVGADSVSIPSSQCSGMNVVDDHTLDVELKERSESFFLFLSSPESGIWSVNDIGIGLDWKTPTRFSGPYKILSRSPEGFMLGANDFSPLQRAYPNGPKTINLKAIKRVEIEAAAASGQIETYLTDYIPKANVDWEKAKGFKIHSMTPSSITMLYSLSPGPVKKVGQNLIESLWKLADGKNTFKAETFLPFSPQNSLKKEDYLPALPQESKTSLRLVTYNTYFQESFLEELKRQAKSVGVEVSIDRISPTEMVAEQNKPSGKWDFELIQYAASERYPAVQIRYMALTHLNDDDLKDADRPEHSAERTIALQALQVRLLKEQRVIPLFFVRTNIIYQDHLDPGNQPTTDCEIQLWKFKEAAK